METIEVYVYTRLSTGKVIQHHGLLNKGKEKATFRNLHTTSHWMVNLSNNEGEVRGRSVWFFKPNKIKAIKALDDKDMERIEKALQKNVRALEGIRQ